MPAYVTMPALPSLSRLELCRHDPTRGHPPTAIVDSHRHLLLCLHLRTTSSCSSFSALSADKIVDHPFPRETTTNDTSNHQTSSSSSTRRRQANPAACLAQQQNLATGGVMASRVKRKEWAHLESFEMTQERRTNSTIAIRPCWTSSGICQTKTIIGTWFMGAILLLRMLNSLELLLLLSKTDITWYILWKRKNRSILASSTIVVSMKIGYLFFFLTISPIVHITC